MTIFKRAKSNRTKFSPQTHCVNVVVSSDDSIKIFEKSSVGGGNTDLLIVATGATPDGNEWMSICGSNENLEGIKDLVIRDMNVDDQMF